MATVIAEPIPSSAVPEGHVAAVDMTTPDRTTFTETKLPDEPKSDVEITLADGTKLRERMTRLDASTETVTSTADSVAANGFTLVLSNALLDDAGGVAKDSAGGFRIAPRHEVGFTGEDLARLGAETAILAAIKEQREIAAAAAAANFRGIALGEKVLAGRTTVSTVVEARPATLEAGGP